MEIQRYLKTGSKFDRGKEVIQRNTNIVQVASMPSLLIRVEIICSTMVDIHKVIGKIPFKLKKGFVLSRHRFTGPYNPLHLQLDPQDNPLPGNEPYNAVDAISMRHEISYLDNPTGKHECDHKMLSELNTLVPKGRREMVDRQLVLSIIGMMGTGCVLDKPVRIRFDKHTVFAKQIDDIWTADLVDMSRLQISLDTNRCIQQVRLVRATEN